MGPHHLGRWLHDRAGRDPVRRHRCPERGALYIEQIGCGSCHIIPGVNGAEGLVGRPSTTWASASSSRPLRNTPANVVIWLRYPQQVVPGNAMPAMGLNEGQARDITAYLYTLG